MSSILGKCARFCYNFKKCPIIPEKFGMVVFPESEDEDIYNTQFDSDLHKMLCGQTNQIQYFEVGCQKANELSIDYSFLNEEQKRTLAFFFLESDLDKTALFIMHASRSIKVWINYELYSIVSGENKMLVINLKAGINSIVLESLNTSKHNYVFIRISDYLVEKEKDTFPCLFEGDMRYHEHFGYVRHSGNYLYDGQPFEFVFYPNHDVLAKDDTAQFSIIDNLTKKYIFKQEIPIKQKCCINIPEHTFYDYDDGHYLVAEIRYTYSNEYIHVERFALFTKPVDNMLEKTCRNALNTINLIEYEYDKLCLQCGVEYIQDKRHNLSLKTSQAALVRSNTNLVKSGIHRDQTIYGHGGKRIFFFNPMYNAVNFYRIYVPENYCADIKYPLIIIHSTYEYNSWSNVFANYTNEPVIAVDISGRGVLLGSYIGEAAIKIALEDVLSRFSIDENRVYATGFSNGGGAAWAMAEAYPDLFAGIYVVSGQANYDLLSNLNNMYLIHVSSPDDSMYNVYQNISERLKFHTDYHRYLMDGFAHNTLMRLWFNEKIFKELLESRKNKYPEQVKYKTFRNRHRKAYWVKIHSIADGQAEGMIDAHIISSQEIEIYCSGISGFSITIPPQINEQQFQVSINGEHFYTFHEKCSRQIHFVRTNTESTNFFEPVNDYIPLIDTHKGNGLLDVFLDPLSIITPVECSEVIGKTAEAYSEPHCNGFIPEVYIKYPIMNYEGLYEASDKAERSYVIIDDGSTHPLLYEIRKSAKISCDAIGWTYNGQMHPGKYCVQQIVNSPWNSRRNIHLISYNDSTMLKKNLFTRKLIIPSYVNGRHEFLNNDALIFDEMGHHGILDYSCEPVDL